MSQHYLGKVGHLPLLLARLIYAARESGKDGRGRDITAAVEILRRSHMPAQRAEHPPTPTRH